MPSLVKADDAKRICPEIVIEFFQLKLRQTLPPNMMLLSSGIQYYHVFP